MEAPETSDDDEQVGITPSVEEEHANNSAGDDDNDEDDAQLYANMTVKEILSSLGTRGKALPMPSTVRRNEERKRKRNRRREMDAEGNEGANGRTGPNENDNDENGSKNGQTPGEGDGDSGDEDENEESASPDITPTPGNVMAPQLVIDENGNIVIDQSSLVISSGTAAPAGAELNAGTTTIDLSYGRKVTSATYSKREKATKWKTVDTVKFYLALRAYGTDFSTMSRIFPGRSRKQLRNKFKKEEKLNLEEINNALSSPMSAEEVERAFGEELRKVEAKEKEEEEERLRDEEGIMGHVNNEAAEAIDVDGDNDIAEDDNEGCTVPDKDAYANGGETEAGDREESNLDEGEAQNEDELDNEINTLPHLNNDEESAEHDEGDDEARDRNEVVEERDVDNEGGNDDGSVPDEDVGNTNVNEAKPEGESEGDEIAEKGDTVEVEGIESGKKGNEKKLLEEDSGASDGGFKEGDEAERVDEVEGGEAKRDGEVEDNMDEKKMDGAGVVGDEVGNTTNGRSGKGGRKRKRRKSAEEDVDEDKGVEEGTKDDGGVDQVGEEEGGAAVDTKKTKEQRGRKRMGGAVRKSPRKRTRRKTAR